MLFSINLPIKLNNVIAEFIMWKQPMHFKNTPLWQIMDTNKNVKKTQIKSVRSCFKQKLT